MKSSFLQWLVFLCLIVLTVNVEAQPGTTRGGRRSPMPVEDQKLSLPTFEARFDRIFDDIQSHFHDKELAKRALPPTLVHDLRTKARAAPTLKAFGIIANELLSHLETSHCDYFPHQTREYYELHAVFADQPTLRAPSIGAVFVEKDVARTDSKPQKSWFVRAPLARRQPDPEEVPFMVGDRVDSIEGRAFDPWESLNTKTGKWVTLRVERRPGEFLEVRRRVHSLHPVMPYVEDIIASAKIKQISGIRIGYVRIWWMSHDAIYGAVFAALAAQNQVDAMIVDLRDGWGGWPEPYYPLFDPGGAYCLCEKPLAVLINRGSRSAKEVFALDFQRQRRGILIGEKTKGAVMPSRGFFVGDDGLLVLAVGQMSQPAYRELEGRGVRPDIVAPWTWEFSAGQDPQRQRAEKELIHGLRRTTHSPALPQFHGVIHTRLSKDLK